MLIKSYLLAKSDSGVLGEYDRKAAVGYHVSGEKGNVVLVAVFFCVLDIGSNA